VIYAGTRANFARDEGIEREQMNVRTLGGCTASAQNNVTSEKEAAMKADLAGEIDQLQNRPK